MADIHGVITDQAKEAMLKQKVFSKIPKYMRKTVKYEKHVFRYICLKMGLSRNQANRRSKKFYKEQMKRYRQLDFRRFHPDFDKTFFFFSNEVAKLENERGWMQNV